MMTEKRIVAAVGDRDPTSKLLEYYQAVGKGNLKITYRDVEARDTRGVVTGYWRSILTCPLTSREYPSSLPQSVLLKGGDEHAIGDGDNNWGAVLNKIGEYQEFNGFVYFKSKKGSRKAAALCAFANIFVTGTDNDDVEARQILFCSTADAVSASGGLCQNSGEKGVSLVSTATLLSPKNKKVVPRSSYPDWVDRLYSLNIVPVDLQIRFREKVPSWQLQQQPYQYLSKLFPTELCAVVNVSSPCAKLTVVSLPMPSREDALESASLLIEEEFLRQNIDISSTKQDHRNMWEIKEGLFRSAPLKTASFVFPPPLSFTAQLGPELYLYELTFSTASGDEFVASSMGLSPEVVTRVGLIFGQDVLTIERASAAPTAIQTKVEIPTRVGVEKVNVTLTRKGIVRLPDNSEECITLLKRFNTILSRWKVYAFVAWASSAGRMRLAKSVKWEEYKHASFHRSCLFVPLCYSSRDGIVDQEIDWSTIRKVVNYELQPYYWAIDRDWKIPILDVAIGFVLVVTVNNFWEFVKLPIQCSWLIALAFIFTMLASILTRRLVDNDVLMNRFILQNGESGIFALSKKDVSAVLECESSQETHLRTKHVKKHAKEDLLRQTSSSNDQLYSIPLDLAYVLPCPRDLLYLCGQHMPKIISSLERAVTTLYVEQRLLELQRKNCGIHATSKETNSCTLRTNLNESKSMQYLVDEATRLFPHVAYQRLEFLGDAVLNYFLAIDLFARNSDLFWDCDDLGDIIQVPMKNETIGKAALRIGISRVLFAGSSKWKSAYHGSALTATSTDTMSTLQYSDLQTSELSEGTLSDVVESLLAVVFMSSGDGGAVIGLLNELQLPGRGLRGDRVGSFTALSACVDGPYPFHLQKTWNEQIVKVGATFMVHPEVSKRLETSLGSLCSVLHLDGKNMPQRSRHLLQCALFDQGQNIENEGDTFTFASDMNVSTSMTPKPVKDIEPLTSTHQGASAAGTLTADDLNRVGIMRDNLFFIGNYALTLSIKSELFKRYPGGSPKDLTLLSFCAFTDDAVAYLLIKNKIQECLFDVESPDAMKFKAAVALADQRGLKEWGKNSRVAQRYPGLGGGLLFGKTSKIEKELTEDLAFSMKALCGALVLSIGIDGMWGVIGPLFEEILAVTPDENLRLYGNNSICKGWSSH